MAVSLFSLSLRNVETILAARGIAVSYETIRAWSLRFGRLGAVRLAMASLPSREVGLGLRGGSGGYIAPGSEGGVTESAMLGGS